MDFNSFIEHKMSVLKQSNTNIDQLRNHQIKILDYFMRSEPDKHIIIQAPTGCGKTLAYALYASYIATIKGERVAILCPTKDLQLQVSQTLDLINQRYTILYGSTEYHCPIRHKFLEGVNAPVVTLFCDFIECKETCEYRIITKNASRASIVVTNYNKFLSSWDILAESKKFELIVFDEAHNLEIIAEENFAVVLSTKLLESVKERIQNLNLQDALQRLTDILYNYFNLDFKLEIKDIVKARGYLEELIKLFYHGVRREKKLNLNEIKPFESRARILLKYIKPIALAELLLVANPEDSPVVKLVEVLNNFCLATSELKDYYTFKGFWDYGYAEIRCEARTRDITKSIISKACRRQCHISATLGNPKNYAEKLGLHNFVICSIEEYPFKIENRLLLGLTDTFPMNKYVKGKGDVNWERKAQKANEILERILLNWPGNTLVYFRSRDEAERAFVHLSKNKNLEKRVLFKKDFENSKDRKRLIEMFKNNRGGILLGFGKMDQGLDFPGESLTMVVMYSLPFIRRTPQMEDDFSKLRKRYNSRIAFEKVDLECAAKRLSQLVGRLIRKNDDFGVALVIDGRFYLKYYKWMRVKKLIPPDIKFKFVNTQKACEELRQFWINKKAVDYESYIEFYQKVHTLTDFLQLY